MAELTIGDTSDVKRNFVPFNAVHQVTGQKKSGSFLLSDTTGFKSYYNSHSLVVLDSSSLMVRVIGPRASDKATSLTVAIIPDSFEELPTTAAQILTISGAAEIQRSLYTTPQTVPVSFAAEVQEQLKPRTYFGGQPKVVFEVEVEGGDTSTQTSIVVSGKVHLSGIGFVKTW